MDFTRLDYIIVQLEIFMVTYEKMWTFTIRNLGFQKSNNERFLTSIVN
jgi:hypothetical protein